MTTLTRQQAASELVDGAIGAWFDGRYACAITLAGAAETGMPKPADGTSMFAAMRGAVMKFGHLPQNSAGDAMNESKNWLKHYGESKADSISVDNAWIYVLRAYFKFASVYKDADRTPNMVRFQAMLDEKVKPFQEAARGLALWVRRLADILSGRVPPPAL